MFSKACEYGVRAVIYIAQKSLSNERASLKDIAREVDSPEAFTAKILQQLAKANLINSVKGPNGGFQISIEAMSDIKLNQIVNVLDGDQIYKGCGLGLKECNDAKPCPLHDKFTSIRTELRTMLEGTSIMELATSLNQGFTYLKK